MQSNAITQSQSVKRAIAHASCWKTLSTLFLMSVMFASSAKAYLIDYSRENPKGVIGSQVKAKFDNPAVTEISFSRQPGMSGFMYRDLLGRPTFYFCHELLTTVWTTIDEAGLVKFRHLVDANSTARGEKQLDMLGQTDSVGQEWARIFANWKLPDGRIATLALEQIADNSASIEQRITAPNSCLR